MTDRKFVALSVLAAAVALAIGVIAGYFGRGTTKPEPPKADATVIQAIIDSISTENLENNLRILTENPHIAGRKVDEVDLVNFIMQRFTEAGMQVEKHPYDVLLSYPNDTDSNYVAIKLANGSLVDKSQPKEKILDPSQDKPGIVNPFNCYSKNGDVQGDLVYVNYGRVEDFMTIAEKVDLRGKICMARYGLIFRGDKALLAERYQCSGLILYSDPADYTVPGKGVYPDDWFLPGTGAQRGSIFKGQGDPLTLHYPSIDNAWRMPVENTTLPNIPVTPIGYNDAFKYLSKLDGERAPDDWQGGLQIMYKYGPGFSGENSTSKMEMHVTTRNERVITHNVIGYLKGYVEPDRYVIIGNHRDAWVFGAMDPSSGTAAMLEVARALGEAVKNGWKPRRTIVFCSWGSEEYALIGSTEWIQEFQKVLGSRTVTYINADTVIPGRYSLSISGSSSLKKIAFDTAKRVPNPNLDEVEAGRTTTYDTWYHVNGKEPTIPTLGSGSDFAMFLQLTGITCVDVGFDRDPALGIVGYPVYHSVYETFDLVRNIVDPGFRYHQAVARVIAELTRSLADSPLLPMDMRLYSEKITQDMNVMLGNYGNDMRNYGNIDTNDLIKAMSNLSDVADAFHKRLDNLDLTDALALRAANDQLMQFERAFIDKVGITGRDEFSHVIYAPSLYNTYGGSAFPGLVDSMFEIGDSSDPLWEEVRRQYAILIYHIGSAASTLEDIVPIVGFSNKHSGYVFQ